MTQSNSIANQSLLAVLQHLSIMTFIVLKYMYQHVHAYADKCTYTHLHTSLTCRGEYPRPPFSSAVWAVGHHGPDTWTLQSHRLRPPGSQDAAQTLVFLKVSSRNTTEAKYTVDRVIITFFLFWMYVLGCRKYLAEILSLLDSRTAKNSRQTQCMSDFLPNTDSWAFSLSLSPTMLAATHT